MIPTRDHDKIRALAEKHHAVPVEMKSSGHDGHPAMLHFLIGRDASRTSEMQPISWEEFFARFELLGLSLACADDPPRFQLVRVEKPLVEDIQH